MKCFGKYYKGFVDDINYYSRVSNRRGGRNKRGGSQISAKIINGDVGKNLQS